MPEFFLYFSPKDTKILFPEINLSEDRFLKHIFEKSYSNSLMDFTGVLRDSLIRLDDDPELLSTSIADLTINHENTFINKNLKTTPIAKNFEDCLSCLEKLS